MFVKRHSSRHLPRFNPFYLLAHGHHSDVLAVWYASEFGNIKSWFIIVMSVWSLTMAAFKINLPLKSYGLEILKCFMSAFILRSSACTVNDIIDRDMDAGVGMPVISQARYLRRADILLSKSVPNTGPYPAVACLYLLLLSIWRRNTFLASYFSTLRSRT
jgi:hypothetical protein